MKRKFTKGPWKYLSGGDVCALTSDQFGAGSMVWGCVEVKSKRYIKVEGGSMEEAEANAKLISAAPELLEALEGLLYSHEKLLAAKGMPRRKSIEAANAAIAKAYGEKA